MTEQSGMDQFTARRKLTDANEDEDPTAGTSYKRSRGRVNLKELKEFYWKYYRTHHTSHGANKAAAKHFGVSPSTISHHLNKLRGSVWAQMLLRRTKYKPHVGRRRRRNNAKAVLIEFFQEYYERTQSTLGMKSAAAERFNVTEPAISYHVRKIKADPSVPDRVKRLL
jgi:DNA-binding MarR family transcriptional regulator